MNRRLISALLMLPSIGFGGQALAQAVAAVSPDPVQGLVSTTITQAIATPGGLSWPIAAVLTALVFAWQTRLAFVAVSKELAKWKPPTIGLRLMLEDTRRAPRRSTDLPEVDQP